MADADSTPWQPPPEPRAVAASIGTVVYAMHRDVWARHAPGLSAATAALLAPPVVLTSAALGAPGADPSRSGRRRADLRRYRANMPPVPPYGRHRRSARST